MVGSRQVDVRPLFGLTRAIMHGSSRFTGGDDFDDRLPQV